MQIVGEESELLNDLSPICMNILVVVVYVVLYYVLFLGTIKSHLLNLIHIFDEGEVQIDVCKIRIYIIVFVDDLPQWIRLLKYRIRI